jgi:hypothetical protein
MIFYIVAFSMALGNEKKHTFFLSASNSFDLVIKLQQQSTFKNEAQNFVASKTSFLLLTFYYSSQHSHHQ